MSAFTKGDRVRFSAHGLEHFRFDLSRHPEHGERLGTVTASTQQNGHTVGVQWDGSTGKSYYHRSFIEKAVTDSVKEKANG